MTIDCPTNSPPWYALQVKSRRESFVASYLSGRGYECFLPVHKVIRRWSDRSKELVQPLFPSYLFCRFPFNDRLPVLMAPGVLYAVGTGKTPKAIEDREINALQLAVASGLPSEPWPYMEVGEQVRVQCGPIAGMEGILIQFKGNHRVVLSVSLLRRSVAIEVDFSWVAPLNPSREGKRPRAAIRPEYEAVPLVES